MTSIKTRLAERDAARRLAAGQLVRVTAVRSYYLGMSGVVEGYDRFMPSAVSVRITSTGHVLSFSEHELDPAAGSGYRAAPGACHDGGCAPADSDELPETRIRRMRDAS